MNKDTTRMCTLEDLYKYYETLTDAKDKAAQHETEFLKIIEAVKGGQQEKRLASQLIARFFKFFPKHTEKAMNAQLDLCEDDDVNIRKQAIRDLPAICKESAENLPRIADVLTQLLQTDDAAEQNLVQSALLTLMRQDIKGALQGVFTQIINGEDTVREKAIKFLSLKLKLMGDDLITPKIEEYVVDESKKVLQDVNADEFLLFISILSGLKCMQTVQGRSQMVGIVTDQADLDSPFDANSADSVDRIIQCNLQALPLFSKNVHSTKFVAYYCGQILSSLSEVQPLSEGEDTQLEILKQLADMSQFCTGLENVSEHLENVFKCTLEHMPAPPAVDVENGENADADAQPALQFSKVECLLFTLHQLGMKCPDFLGKKEDEAVAERMKEFRVRLQYFARGVQTYLKQLRASLQGKKGEALKTDENKVKVVALKTTNNINLLIKDFMHVPPIYKAAVKLSWKPAQVAADTAPSAGTKRTSLDNKPVVAPKAAKSATSHGDRAVYAPPAGKYSDKAGSAPVGAGGQRGGGGRRGRGRGGWRGRY